MSNSYSKAKHFSALRFILIIISSVTIYLLILALTVPSVWEVQLNASFTTHILTFLACHLMFGIFEHPFHRYVLHSPLIPGLSTFYKSHTKHHGLTRVTWRQTGVENFYPILEEKQHDSSFFPWYSYSAFVLVFTPLFILIYWMFPAIPIFLDGALALAWSISLYELVHAVEHYSLEKWLPKLEHRNSLLKKFWRTMYAFHLRHHVNNKCNENISGFFGIPISDFLLGTWINPRTLYNHKEYLDKEEFGPPPRPIFFICWIDDFAEKRKQKQRSKK